MNYKFVLIMQASHALIFTNKKITTIMKKLIYLLFLYFFSSLLYAGTNYVWIGSPAAVSPYSSWETAAHSIQDAVDVASDGDFILVTNGFYDSGIRVTPGFSLSNRLVIAANVSVCSVNGPANTFIIGAETVGGGRGPAAVRAVFMMAGKLDGFTVSNGHSLIAGNPDYDYYNQTGGGIWITNECVVTNCVIVGNSATKGGGVYCHQGGTVNNCIIHANSANNGGGIYPSYLSSINNCLIISNKADFYGGGIYSRGKFINNCTISKNSAVYWGGGAYLESNGIMVDCLINDNKSEYNGGGIFGGSYTKALNCTISSNHADNFGGGVYNQGGYFSECMISQNSAIDSGGGIYFYGGAISKCIISENSATNFGGGVFTHAGSMTNSLIANYNNANYGGGIYCEGSVLYNCTISSNNANVFGGGIYFFSGSILINNIISHNSALQSGDNWHSFTSTTPYSITYSCINPTNNLPGQYECISADPMFGENYHPLEGSPCIDSGVYMSWMSGTTDLDGNRRVSDGHVDMGCYELVPEPAALSAIISYLLLVLGIWRKLQNS